MTADVQLDPRPSSADGPDRRRARRARRWVAGFAAALTLALNPAEPAAAAVDVDRTPTRSWTVDGRVYATEIVGDVVIVGGQFTTATAPNGTSAARRNLAAFRLNDGSLIGTWRADSGGAVRALDSDGTSLWVGGFFGTVGGVSRQGVAKVSVATGAVDPVFNARLGSGGVRGLDVDSGSLYVGGLFTTVAGATRNRVAKVDATTGVLDGAFNASANGNVLAVVKSPTQPVVYVAGSFSTLNGAARAGLGGVSSASGATSGPALNGATAPTYAVDVSADGSRVFSGAGSNAVTSWRTSTGTRVWRRYGEGDIQALRVFDDTVYFGFHDGFEDDLTVKVLAADAATGVLEADWRPRMTQFWGVFGIDVSAAAVVIGGEFTSVDGVTARGWARFLP